MKTLALNVPDSLKIENKELINFIAAKLYEDGKLTISQAAEMAKLSVSDFMNELYKFNVSIFNYSASELASDVSNATESIRRY